MDTMTDRAALTTPDGGVPRRRGKSKQTNWKRPEQVAVVKLDLDLSGDPVMRRRVERQFNAAWQLERALKREAQSKCQAYWAAEHERAKTSPKAVRERLGLDRGGFEMAAYRHVDDSKWLRHHLTKAVACHMADHVWEAVKRNLFVDASGKRMGVPHPGRWWGFTKLAGRARSHTKATPVWETWRLAGSLQGHLDTYGGGLTIDEALAVPAGVSLFSQPGALPIPVMPARMFSGGGWWDYQGPLCVVFTGLPGGDIVMPVRLPQGAGRFPRLVFFLADPGKWHKIDLVRVQDRRAPGGWRYQAHLTVLGSGYVSPSTTKRRGTVPGDRLAGIDANVSNIAVVSMNASTLKTLDANPGVVEATYVTPTPEEYGKAITLAAHTKWQSRRMDRSRRAANPSQYHMSKAQQRRANRRVSVGLPAKQVQLPKGARLANAKGVPTTAYREDALTSSYRRLKADLAQGAASTAQRKTSIANRVAADLVTRHGNRWVIEQADMRNWARLWGKRMAVTTPGRLIMALQREAEATGGTWREASTFTTAMSQVCLCGRREKKPLSQRWHNCPDCGLQADRDLLAAALAACVTFTNPTDPSTAQVDNTLRGVMRRRVEAQNEGPARSTTAQPSVGADGSNILAPAGRNDSTGQPRNRKPHPSRWKPRHRKNQTVSGSPPGT